MIAADRNEAIAQRSKWQLLVLVIAGVVLALAALLLIGGYVPGVPYVGGAGSLAVSLFTPWFAIVPLALAGLAWWLRHSSGYHGLAKTLTVLGVLCAFGGAIGVYRLLATARAHGADVSVITALDPRFMGKAPGDQTVPYTDNAGSPLLVRIYKPKAAPAKGKWPVLMYVHGGGWIYGSNADRAPDMRWFADQGWLVVSVDYTLSKASQNLWNVTESQVGCALAWTAENASRLGGDASRLAMFGDSAGGNLVINSSYRANQGTLTSSCGGEIPPVRAISTVVPVVDPSSFHQNADPALGDWAKEMTEAYVGGSPRRFPDRYKAISSFTHISRSAPPTLIFGAPNDHLVPPRRTFEFAEEARQQGVKVELVRVPFGEHGFDFTPSIGRQMVRSISLRFLNDNIR